jgi:hypothetical protein
VKNTFQKLPSRSSSRIFFTLWRWKNSRQEHEPVTMPDIDGWHARDLIAPLFFNDNTELHNLIRRRLILPYLTGSFHSSFIEELRAWQLTPPLSAMRRLSYSLLPMITLFKLQVFGMVPRIARRYYQYFMITLILRTLTIRM